MTDIELQFPPGGVNFDVLTAEIKAVYAIDGLATHPFRAINVQNGITAASLQALVDVHDPSVLTVQQEATLDKELSQETLKAYLKDLMLSPSPNYTTAKTELTALVANYPNIQLAITRMGLLFGEDTATDQGYVRSVYRAAFLFT